MIYEKKVEIAFGWRWWGEEWPQEVENNIYFGFLKRASFVSFVKNFF